MHFETAQIEVIVVQFVHVIDYLVLDYSKPLILLYKQFCQLFFTILFISIQYVSQFAKVLLNFVLDYLSVTLLYALKILLSLLKLELSIEYQSFNLLYLLLYFAHNLRDNVDLAQS